MDIIKKIIDVVKSPLGSIAVRMIVPLTKIGIEWTPTKKDDYYLAKVSLQVIEARIYAKQLAGIQISKEEQKALLYAQEAVKLAYKEMIAYENSKKKKK